MKNPYIFWGIFAILLIGGFFLGNSAWAKSVIHGKPTNGNGNIPPADGSVCKLADGTNGIIVNGVCTGGRQPDETTLERTSATNGTNANPQITGAGSNVPNLILVPYTSDCQTKYTSQSPYPYGGCRFVYKQNIKQNGISYCQLEKVSCP